MQDVAFSFAGHRFQPLACGALWWPGRRALLVADLHFEKASWFAGHGQPLPPYDSLETLNCLEEAFVSVGPAEVWCLGDSFHDRGGVERLPHEVAARLRRLVASAEWHWIGGNHDGLSAAALGGRVADEAEVDGVVLRHEARASETRPEVSGHFHPKLRLTVRGRGIARRCFVQTPAKLLLPAYGALSGGLDVGHPAIAASFGRVMTALVPTPERLLRFQLG